MNGQETVASPPDTLIGLGPPEPPGDPGGGKSARYEGEPPAETLRAWTTSGVPHADEVDSADEFIIPQHPLFPVGVWRSVWYDGAGNGRLPGRRWAAGAAGLALAAAASLGVLVAGPPAAPSRAPAAARAPATTRVVGGPWVLSPSPESPSEPDLEEVPAEGRPPAAARRPSARRSAPSSGESLAPRVPVVAVPLAAVADVLIPDEARIETVAESVRLEDDASPEAPQPTPAAPLPQE